MANHFLDRVLITNDDGIDAPGMQCLSEIAQAIAKEVWIVAPAYDQSGKSTSISVREVLEIKEIAPRHFAITGTPADCVIYAVKHLLKDQPPQLILSGVNIGTNLGNEAFISGTLGAAIISRLFGIASMALSQDYIHRSEIFWETAKKFAPDLIQKLYAQACPDDTIYNINFPPIAPDQVKPPVVTRNHNSLLDSLNIDVIKDPAREDSARIVLSRTIDLDDVESESHWLKLNHVTVTPINFSLTNETFSALLSTKFNGS